MSNKPTSDRQTLVINPVSDASYEIASQSNTLITDPSNMDITMYEPKDLS